MKGFLNFKKGRFWHKKRSSSPSANDRTVSHFTPERKVSINIINGAVLPSSQSESFSSACAPPTEKAIDVTLEGGVNILTAIEQLLALNVCDLENFKGDLLNEQFNLLAKRYIHEGFRARFIKSNRFEQLEPVFNAKQWWSGADTTSKVPMDLTVEELLMFYRYFKANKFVVEDTVDMWKKDLEWIDSVGYTGLINEYLYNIIGSVPDMSYPKKAPVGGDIKSIMEIYPAGYYGRDLVGRPVYYDRVGKLNASELLSRFPIDQLRRYWVLSHELMQRLILPSCSLASHKRIYQGVTVIDLNGLSVSHISGKTRQILREVVCMSQAHYPESMAITLIINAPWIFQGVWKFIKPFIDKGSVQKIKILSSKGQSLIAEMSKYIAETELPPFISGSKTGDSSAAGWMFQPSNGPWTDLNTIRPQLNRIFPNIKLPNLAVNNDSQT